LCPDAIVAMLAGMRKKIEEVYVPTAAGLVTAVLLYKQHHGENARQFAVDLIMNAAAFLAREIGPDEVRAVLDEVAKNLPPAHCSATTQ
jgi:hypothetical protein